MTDDELTTTVRRLETGLKTMSEEWGTFLEIEARRREEDAAAHRRREESDSQRAEVEVENWQKSQTFLAKHGMKIAGVAFSAVTAGLAWYGAEIRSEIQAEQHVKSVDDRIQDNTDNLKSFKEETNINIKALQKESVNQTLMINEGFRRVDKIMIKATKLTEEDMPEIPPEFRDAVEEAEALKIHAERFESKK